MVNDRGFKLGNAQAALQFVKAADALTDPEPLLTALAGGEPRELAPLLGGFAAEQGHLRFPAVVLACAVGVFVLSSACYLLGRWRAAWVRLKLRNSPPLVRKVLSALPGAKRPAGAGRFFYPRQGFGQISDALHAAAVKGGAAVHLDAQVTGVSAEGRRVRAIDATVAGQQRTFAADYVLSTIPVTALAGLVRTDGPAAPLEAVRNLRSRAMVLIYLTLDTNQFTEFDAHYFPESAIRISRLSEPKNYSLTAAPGKTVLCAELPCALDDAEWSASDEELGRLMVRDLETAGLGPVPRVLHVQTRRLPHAYPLYTRGYREAFDAVDRWVGTLDGLVTFGRQGLFAHDNTHHTMAMAYALVECLSDDGTFDKAGWAKARTSFEDHVVED